MESSRKPHVVCIPLPAQGHINPMLKLAKLLHYTGFHITFVHTEFNYNRLLKSKDSDPLDIIHDDFQFRTVADGLPASNQRGILDLPDLCVAMPVHCKQSFKQLISELNSSPDVPPVSCIVSDGVMSFTLEVAREFRIPEILFFTPSACGMLGYLQYEELRERGYFPLTDESCFSNGYLDTELDWIPAMKGIRLKDLPSFVQSTNPGDIMFNYNLKSLQNALRTSSLILNSFEDLEKEVLDAIRIKFPTLYTIGPLSMLEQQLRGGNLDSLDSSLWKQDMGCIDWLDKKKPGSVVYVNYGSLVILTPGQLREFGWGLANSKHPFLWVIRPNLVNGGTQVISHDFLDEIKDRGLLLDWCPQEKILGHPSIGGFLTHCGWNSTLESICEGVPMVCWPFFGEQPTNCLYICTKWEIGMEIDNNVKRDEVEGLVRELMEGSKGKEMKEKIMEWKDKADRATKPGGTSYNNFKLLVNHLRGESRAQKP
ncbi:7-deoxyloganetin glucosyltransferase-like [Coffea eugenioides]|uniref:Glycosyltransferase n=1 Tax=Coffea arabica TaxID=13443 RepID=A0A6P6WDZ3_COFAR|nr:7-deoxyloganetin glucosyltransferase-like [Coffea arabica]XP_027161704.1 7-deoxyloganetin glucosyltransferase-like [Coffea eugenioides]